MWPENVQEIEVSTEKLTLGDKSTVHNLMSVGKKGLITQLAHPEQGWGIVSPY